MTQPLLNVSHISKETFIESVYKLHSFELIDIYAEKAVKISEQCLSNYILKYTFLDKKLLLLSDAIRVYFPVNQSKTITSVNVLTVSFYSEEMIAFIEKHHSDSVYMRSLFDSIAKMTDEQRIAYIKLYLEYEKSIENFKHLPLFSSFSSWSGSEVPLIHNKIEFLNKLSQ